MSTQSNSRRLAALGSLALAGTGASAQTVLLDQLPWDGVSGFSSVEFSFSPAQSSRTADDLTLPPATSGFWHITRLKAVMLSNGLPGIDRGMFEVYADSGGMGPADAPPLTQVAASGFVDLGQINQYRILEFTVGDGAATIAAGAAGSKLWISPYVLMQFSPDGQAFFAASGGGVLNGSEGYHRSSFPPGWQAVSSCGCIAATDFAFRVEATDGPAIDNCGAAYAISDGTFNFDTRGATTDGPSSGGCAGGGAIAHDVWFRYTPPSTLGACAGTGMGNVTVSTCGSSFDTAIEIYAATCPVSAGAALACNDDDSACGGDGGQSRVMFAAATGQSYLIRVGSTTGATGPGRLSVSIPIPPNDTCAGAIDVTSAAPVAWCNTEAHVEQFFTPGCTQGTTPGFDLWYRFTAGGTGRALFSICNGSIAVSRMQVFRGCAGGVPSGLASCGGAPGPCSGPSVQLCVSAGEQFLIRVGSGTGGAGSGALAARLVADFNGNGQVSVQDIFDFLAAFFASDPAADVDGSGAITVQDLFDYLGFYFGQC